MNKIQIIRGFNDILPDESPKWQFLESKINKVLNSYNYQEVRLPILEKSELFHRSVGETSDIVSKETYDFADRNGDSLTMRPEGTAGCVRMVIEKAWLIVGKHRSYITQDQCFVMNDLRRVAIDSSISLVLRLMVLMVWL